jgi:hypothetical protein
MRKRTTSPTPPSAKRGVYTRGEVLQQEEFIFNGIISGVSFETIAVAFRQQFPGTGRIRVQTLYERVGGRMREEARERDKNAQLEAVQRSKRRLVRLHMTLDQFDPKDKSHTKEVATIHQRILAEESFLADLTGSREPMKVEVNVQVKETLLAVVMNASPEEMNKRLADMHETRRLARLAQSSIDTAAE